MLDLRQIAFVVIACVLATAVHAIPVFPVDVVAKYPHDRDAFTQGIAWHDGRLFESTGLYGRSTLREVELETGRVLRRADLDRREFAEDITVLDGRLWQLTWVNGRAHVYDPETLERRMRFRYDGEGWGLTHLDGQLVKSDGSDVIEFVNPRTFSVMRRLRVHAAGTPVRMINAMQAIDGRIYANVWQTTRIAEIDPGSGEVTAWIELAPLLAYLDFSPRLDIESPNGIAFDPDARRLFVTGKLWPWLFEIEVERDGRRWP